MRVQRRHLNVGDRWIVGPESLNDLAVDDCATAVADEVQRGQEQPAAQIVVKVHDRGEEGVGRGFGEAGVVDVRLLFPVQHEHDGLAVLDRRDTIAAVVVLAIGVDQVLDEAAIGAIVLQDVTSGRVGDHVRHIEELLRLLEW